MNKCGNLATNKTNLGLAAHFQIETKEKLWATDCHEYYYLGAPGDHLDEFVLQRQCGQDTFKGRTSRRSRKTKYKVVVLWWWMALKTSAMDRTATAKRAISPSDGKISEELL